MNLLTRASSRTCRIPLFSKTFNVTTRTTPATHSFYIQIATPKPNFSSVSTPVSTFSRFFSSSKKCQKVNLTFISPEGENIPVVAEEGVNILELAHEHDIDLEGACECSCACSTCHVILEDGLYDKLEEPLDEELDMLDLAFGLTETSRLGCQIKVNSDFEGAKIKLPAATRNFYVDGAKPTKH